MLHVCIQTAQSYESSQTEHKHKTHCTPQHRNFLVELTKTPNIERVSVHYLMVQQFDLLVAYRCWSS